jgi:hypothetical protein
MNMWPYFYVPLEGHIRQVLLYMYLDYISMFPWKVTSDKFYCTCTLIIFLCSLGRSHKTSFTVHVPWLYFYVPLEGHIRQVLLYMYLDYISMFPWKVTSDKFYCTLIIFLCSLGRSHQTSFTVHVPWLYFYVPLEGHIRQVLLYMYLDYISMFHWKVTSDKFYCTLIYFVPK